jgi:hypothetical protein
MKSTTEALMEIVQKLGAEAYQQAGPEPDGQAGGPQQGDGEKPGGEDVVEGEFKEA